MTVEFSTRATYTCDQCGAVGIVDGVGAAPPMPEGWKLIDEKHCCGVDCAREALTA